MVCLDESAHLEVLKLLSYFKKALPMMGALSERQMRKKEYQSHFRCEKNAAGKNGGWGGNCSWWYDFFNGIQMDSRGFRKDVSHQTVKSFTVLNNLHSILCPWVARHTSMAFVQSHDRRSLEFYGFSTGFSGGNFNRQQTANCLPPVDTLELITFSRMVGYGIVPRRVSPIERFNWEQMA